MAVRSFGFLVSLLFISHHVTAWQERLRFQSFRIGEVAKCEFPSAVFIKFTDKNYNHNECGGVVLDNKRVATAAHCVPPDLRKVDLKIGIVNSGKRGIVLPWRRVISMPASRKDESLNDLAIITLARPIHFYQCYKGIELAKPDESFADRTCVSLGWVLDKKTNNKLLTKTEHSIVSNSECSQHGDHIEEGQLCANGMDISFGETCLGNAGVPLICMRENGDQVLAGFSAKGDVCSTKHSIFTDVASHNRWLSTKH